MYSVILFASSSSLLSLLAEVEHCQNLFSNLPANGMRCILLYYLLLHAVYSECWRRFNLTLPKLVFKFLQWHDIYLLVVQFISLLTDVQHYLNMFSNIPDNSMRYILLCFTFLIQFVQFASEVQHCLNMFQIFPLIT